LYAIELDGHQIAFDVPSDWEGFGYGVFAARLADGKQKARAASARAFS